MEAPSCPPDGLGALDRRRTVTGILACSLYWLVPRSVWAADTKRFSVKIEGGRVPENENTLQVNEGDSVEIEFTSDRTLTLHLHGIDLETTVAPGKPAVMRFQATAAGRFPVEAHGARALTALIYVEVYPR